MVTNTCFSINCEKMLYRIMVLSFYNVYKCVGCSSLSFIACSNKALISVCLELNSGFSIMT